MSIFGSREEDPLLQDDPFAPQSEDDSPEADDTDPSETQPSDSGPRSQEKATHTPPSGDTRSVGTSVFGDNKPNRASGNASASDNTDTRVLVRLVDEAANGRLGRLNAAINDGWRLRSVELRNEAPDAPGPNTGPSRSLAFVLHKSDGA